MTIVAEPGCPATVVAIITCSAFGELQFSAAMPVTEATVSLAGATSLWRDVAYELDRLGDP
ncbi:hypothetical protein [Mycolicibacterium arenosum]|uniref:Uncharacterized protein n=1 Tax=Mycolicibacterium arenosum TaxID=2952157 RepID=A0ABT1MCQ5_9MYCO|nr:hypothetical protein [Mycolicibacterium sp. CAU 1645]MCP9276948.1 hypothetical protein [Mycolicibacterium sp. CAU 1645]